MLATLQTVDPSTRSWDTKYGKKAAFMVTFTDGRTAQVNTNWEIVARKVEAWQGLIGQERDYEFTEQAPWPDGNPKPPKVKLAEQQAGSGGQGTFSPRPPKDDAAITRAVALKAAVHVAQDADDAIFIAEVFEKWLKMAGGDSTKEATAYGEGVAPSEGTSPATTSTPVAQPSGHTKEGGGGGPHVHQFERIPNVTKWEKCALCPETREKKIDG